jgi:glutaredoxin
MQQSVQTCPGSADVVQPGLQVVEMMRFLTLLVLLLIFSAPSTADVYKWTDEKGLTHYSDKKPENQSFTEVVAGTGSYESVSYGTSNFDAGKKVIIFSASWCGICKKAKTYFRRNGIPFTEHDIEKSTRAKSLYKQLDAKGVPVILVGKERMNGFTEAGFERIYK